MHVLLYVSAYVCACMCVCVCVCVCAHLVLCAVPPVSPRETCVKPAQLNKQHNIKMAVGPKALSAVWINACPASQKHPGEGGRDPRDREQNQRTCSLSNHMDIHTNTCRTETAMFCKVHPPKSIPKNPTVIILSNI